MPMSPLIYTLLVTHITISGVTLYLHRSQAHRSVSFHPVISHFFRFWLWMTTGMVTKEWVAIHRKHHAKCETENDPHSPLYLGVWNVMFLGVLFYKRESRVQETIDMYGQNTPNDWIENNLYSKHSTWGIISMFIINVFLFGFTGVLIWLIQMAWIPFWAAGFINGIGHWFGYRTFASKDTSTNISPLILPIGIIIGGEEFHNNHHAFPRSARLSYKPWELDIGWVYIQVLSKFGLAKVDEFAPYPESESKAFTFNHDLSFFSNKMRSVRRYEKTVLREILSRRFSSMKDKIEFSYGKALRLLMTNKSIMTTIEKSKVSKIVKSDELVASMYKMKEDLEDVWHGVGLSITERTEKVREWCKKADNLGHAEFTKFSMYLKKKMAL